MKMENIIIDFEGIDGSGKRTQSKLLEKELTRRGFLVTLYSYPDYESKYGKIIESFLNIEINLTIQEQILLYLLDFVKDEGEIRKKLDKGNIIIMDRYFLSTIAYQCANHFDYNKAKELIKLIDLPIPSIIFNLDLSVETSIDRKNKQKGTCDRFEKDRKLLKEVADVYSKMIAENFPSSNWIRLNGTENPEIINKKVISAVNDLINAIG